MKICVLCGRHTPPPQNCFWMANGLMVPWSYALPPQVAVSSAFLFSAGIRSIADAWEMNSTDTVLHCLPLHHVHGVVNALATPLAMGARVHMLPKFDAEQVNQC